MSDKKPSWLLIVGIVFIPIIFAWFTLKEGYSKNVRYISFGWLVLAFIFGSFSTGTNTSVSRNKERLTSHKYDGVEVIGKILTIKTSAIEDESIPKVSSIELINRLEQKARVTIRERDDLVNKLTKAIYDNLRKNPQIEVVSIERILERTTPNEEDKYGNVTKAGETITAQGKTYLDQVDITELRKYNTFDNFRRGASPYFIGRISKPYHDLVRVMMDVDANKNHPEQRAIVQILDSR